MSTEEMSFHELKEIVSACLDEVIQLKDENTMMKAEITQLNEVLENLIIGQKQLCHSMEKCNQMLQYNSLITESALNNFKYELIDERTNLLKDNIPHICSIEESINQLLKGKSMGRFGDGEFAIMSHVFRQKFQRLDDKLANRLKEVIASNEDNFCVAIADNYGNLDSYNEEGKRGIRDYMTEETRMQHWEFLDKDRIYHNTYITRPYVIYKDNQTTAPKERFESLKKIWNNRKVIFVEGSKTRLGYKNDLFDNAKEIKRIEAPAESSFDRYEEILNASLQFGEKDTLFLIALGPSAAVLAYDLYKYGFQSIDIGHLDLEYEWFLKGMGKRCEINYKYNNEFTNGDQVRDILEQEYNNQILIQIGK